MSILNIRTNASQATDVLIRDMGIIIPNSGGSETLSILRSIDKARLSSDLLALTADDAHGAGSHTLLLNDGSSDITHDAILGLTGTTGVTPLSQIVTVAKSSGDYTTVGAALAGITDAATGKRYVIQVYPGDYIETAPIICKDYISIEGSGHENTRLIVDTTFAHGLVGATDIEISNIQVKDNAGPHAGYAAYHVPIGKHDIHIRNVKSKNIAYGALVESGASGEGVIIDRLTSGGGNTTTMIRVTSASKVVISGLFQEPGVISTNGVEVDGAGTSITLSECTLEAGGSGSGLYITNGGKIHCISAHLHTFNYGVRVDSGSNIHGEVSVEDSTTWDLLVEDSASTVSLIGRMRREFISQMAGSSVIVLFQDNSVEGEEGTSIRGKLEVGSFDHPAQANVGEGREYTQTMQVYQYDVSAASGSRFTDVTVAAKSLAGSTFQFPIGAAIGDALVFAAPQTFVGFSFTMTTLMIKAASTALVWEFWNGSTWTTVNIMETINSSPYTSYANDALTNNLMSDIRFGETTGWAADDNVLDNIPNYGLNHYALRVRMSGQAPSIAPIFQQSKLEPNHVDLGAGGIQFWGTAEVDGIIPKDQTSFDRSNAGDANDYNYNISANIAVNSKRNRLDNAQVLSIILRYPLPKYIDTAKIATLTMQLIQGTAGTGNTEIELDIVIAGSGFIFDGSGTEISFANIIAVPGTNGQQYTTSFDIDISTATTGDQLWVRLFRDATTGNTDDTFAGDVGILQADLNFKRYRP